MQADTIVPEPLNPASWDRYAYVFNNPLRYTDPSGHKYDPGGVGGCGTECRRESLLSIHKKLKKAIDDEEMDDLDAFSQLVHYASILAQNDPEKFVEDVGSLLTGHSSGKAWINELKIQAGYGDPDSFYQNIKNDQLQQNGFASIFQDPGVGGNQPHHYWFYVQVAFESGFLTSSAGNFLHETILARGGQGMSFNDFALGIEGAQLGNYLANGDIKPSEASGYISQTLSPNSAEAHIWTYLLIGYAIQKARLSSR